MKVESGLADPNDLGMGRQRRQPVNRDPLMVGGFVRVGADRKPDRIVGLGDRAHLIELVEPGADSQQSPDPSGPRTGNDRLALGSEIGKIEMAVAVDQHRPALYAFHAVGASTNRGKIPAGFGKCVPATSGDAPNAAKSRDPSATESWSSSFAADPGTKGCARIARCRIVSARV